MTHCFIDTNILISYCNPFDKFHTDAVKFIQNCSGPLYLITTVREEFMRKVQDFLYKVLDHSLYYLKLSSRMPIKKFRSILNQKMKDDSLSDFILSLFDDLSDSDNIQDLNNSILNSVIIELLQRLNDCVSRLTKNWIEIPSSSYIYYDHDFKKYESYLRKLIHYPDYLHLALAINESQKRSNSAHQYVFYTNDRSWSYIRLNKFNNFRIKLLSLKQN